MINIEHAAESKCNYNSIDTFSHIINKSSLNLKAQNLLSASLLDTKLGSMIAIASEDSLYLLEFIERKNLDHEVESLKKLTKSSIIIGITEPIRQVQNELNAYFNGNLTKFNTPLAIHGNIFQKRVWHELMKIPFGETRSYLAMATAIDHPKAFRAIAKANSTNHFAIIIPCHRVIYANGKVGGYAGGIARKEALLKLENPLI